MISTLSHGGSDRIAYYRAMASNIQLLIINIFNFVDLLGNV